MTDTDDATLLEELRRLPGWTVWYPDIDELAQRAQASGLLRHAYEAAEARWWAAMGTSSNSSAIIVVMGPNGRVEDVQALLLLLWQD